MTQLQPACWPTPSREPLQHLARKHRYLRVEELAGLVGHLLLALIGGSRKPKHKGSYCLAHAVLRHLNNATEDDVYSRDGRLQQLLLT